LVEKFLTVLEKLPQVLRGDFFDSHCRLGDGSPSATNVVVVVVLVFGVVVIRISIP